jgi:hypothetical protein
MNIFLAMFKKNVWGNKVINKLSAEKSQFPCGKNILWNASNEKEKFMKTIMVKNIKNDRLMNPPFFRLLKKLVSSVFLFLVPFILLIKKSVLAKTIMKMNEKIFSVLISNRTSCM